MFEKLSEFSSIFDTKQQNFKYTNYPLNKFNSSGFSTSWAEKIRVTNFLNDGFVKVFLTVKPETIFITRLLVNTTFSSVFFNRSWMEKL